MNRLPLHLRRRWVRLSLAAVLTVISLALAGAMLRTDQPLGNEQLIGWAGLFVSLAALAAALAALFPRLEPPADPGQLADDLKATVEEQWNAEVTARGLREPKVIPLSWSGTGRPVAAEPESVVGTTGGRVLRMSLDGRLEGGFDTAAARLAERYERIPGGRLVVLGEPGAGKTVLAVMLTLGLLASRSPGTRVPVLLSVSTWDPVTEPLDDWITDTLATTYYGGRPDIPRRLLAQRLLLPVLDGLDEIPEVSRRSAVRRVNEALGEGRGVVLTCRSVEYEDVIEKGSPRLRRAPVVEVDPVRATDAMAYLSEVSWPPGTDWEPVYARLRAEPEGELAVALSTPLTLTLARTVYTNCDLAPAGLLGFDSAHAVEDHLVDQVIPAAYAPPPGGGGGPGNEEWRGAAGDAEKWLTYLAGYLHKYGERELAWWLMSHRLMPHYGGLAIGLALALVIMVGMSVALLATSNDSSLDTAWPTIAGIGTAVITTITWYAAPARPPARLRIARRESLKRLRAGAASGAKLALLLLLPPFIAGALLVSLSGSWSNEALLQYGRLAAVALGGAVALSLALAVHAWLDAPPEGAGSAGPLDLMRQDRISSLALSLLSGVVLGAVAIPLVLLGLALGFTALTAVTQGSVSAVPPDLLPHVITTSEVYRTRFGTVVSVLAPAVALTLLILLVRAWPRFALLRLVLAAQGKLPLRLARFLNDARERQLLRQSGGTYQFRHIRLQERLAQRPPAPDSPRRISPRRRLQAVVAVLAVLVSGAVVRSALPEDTSHTIAFTGSTAGLLFSPPEHHLLFTLGDGQRLRRWDTHTGGEVTGHRARHTEKRLRKRNHSYTVMAARADGALLIFFDMYDDSLGATLVPWGGGPDRVLTRREAARTPILTAVSVHDSADASMSGGTLHGAGAWYKKSVEAMPPVAPGDDGEPAEYRERFMENRFIELAVSADNTLRVVDLGEKGLGVERSQSGQPVCFIPDAVDEDSARPYIVMDADGERFVTAQNNTLRIWDDECRSVLDPITTAQEIEGIALSPDGRRLAVTSDAGVTRIWQLPHATAAPYRP